jgi:hypothetical protein
MVTSAETQVASLEVGDAAIFVGGDVPFEVAAVSEVVADLRLLDLVPVRGERTRTRVTMWAAQVVTIVGQDRAAEPAGPLAVSAAG